MTFAHRFAILVAIVSISGCTTGPDYQPKTPSDLGVPEQYVGSDTTVRADNLDQWWSAYRDPLLDTLVARALAGNLDIAQSLARVAQARESLNQSRANQLPQIDIGARDGRNVNLDGPDAASFSRSIDARWSADIFGGAKRSTEAALASYEAAGLSLANVQTLIAAEVARNYIDMLSLRDRIAIARASIAIQDDNVQIASWRAQAGLVSAIDVEQAKVQRAQTSATLPALQRSEAQARFRLSVLTGQAPGAVDGMLAGRVALPDLAMAPVVGAPADILRQRPDVRASERDLAAATARIGIAKAQLYPALTLTGNLTTSSTDFGNLTDLITGGLFASIAQTIFDAGKRKSAVRAQIAAADGALAAYRAAVLNALEDVENALAAKSAAEARISTLSDQVGASRNAALLARSNYRAGLSDFRTLLEAERSLLAANDGLAAARADRINAAAQLYLALGGGWDPNAPIATTDKASP